MTRKDFLQQVRSLDTAAVGAALAAKPAWATAAEANGMTPLHQCARTNLKRSGKPGAASVATAQALLDAGADINCVRIIMDEGEAFHATALWYAVAWGQNHLLARFLLESGADPNHCLFASTWARDAALTEMLLEYGAEVDPVAFGDTPLLGILKVQRPAAAPVLIKYGADINYRDP